MKNVTVARGWLEQYDSLLWGWLNADPVMNFDDTFSGGYRQFCNVLTNRGQRGQQYTVYGGPDASVVGFVGVETEVPGYAYKTGGVVISPSHRGSGYATAAVLAVIQDLLSVADTPNLRVSAELFKHNKPMRYVLHKCGFTEEGTHIGKTLQGGSPVDTVTYGLVVSSPQMTIGEEV